MHWFVILCLVALGWVVFGLTILLVLKASSGSPPPADRERWHTSYRGRSHGGYE